MKPTFAHGVPVAHRGRPEGRGRDEGKPPEEPHWYLMIIGTDPSVRGKGFGQALMHSRLDRCDDEHAPAYLEASKPELMPYH